MLKGFSDVRGSDLFQQAVNPSLRGHALKLAKPRASLQIREKSFTHRIVNDWNRLPSTVVNAKSVETFKNRLDQCWDSLFPDLV